MKNPKELNHITYEEGERAWFTMIPNIIDDIGLDVYSYRLYIHLRRVAGEEGLCWQSTSTLAKWCNMSNGAIVKAKKKLLEVKLIEIKKVRLNNGGQSCDHIRINDIWKTNYEWFSENDVPNDSK